MTNRKIVLFGATGYTGHLVAEQLVQRGLRPLLCGRSREKLKRLSENLGGLDITMADVREPAGLTALLDRGDVLISTVGPFATHGMTALRAAIAKAAVYIDSTGEPAFIQEVFENHSATAHARGVTLIPACGYDYVAGNCAAGIALQSAGLKAARVDVGYFLKSGGNFGSLEMSQGTAASMRLAMLAPAKVWKEGQLRQETGATRVRSFSIDGSVSAGLSISSSEHFSLPRIYPHLRDIGTYLGWFGSKTHLMRYAALFHTGMMKIPGYRSAVKSAFALLPESKGRGPNAAQRRKQTSHIIAEAFDSEGDLIARADLVGSDGYSFTAKIIAWAADMARQQKVLKTGAAGPVEAFGLDALIEGCAQAGLTRPIPGKIRP